MESQPLLNELRPSEKLLWSGQPQRGIRFRQSDIFFVPFSLMWGGFAMFWEATAIYMTFLAPKPPNTPAFIGYIFPLFGLPFVIVGLYLIFGRFFVDAKSREKTYYGVTDQRVIILSRFFGNKVQSLPLKNLPQIELNQKPDGSGTILFGPSSPLAAWSAGQWPGSGRHQVPSFEMVENVRTVHDIIQRAIN